MTQAEICSLLSSFGIPVGFNRIKKGTKLPFITYHIAQPNNFGADNTVYHEIHSVEFRVYESREIDLALHENIKNILKQNEIYWTSDNADVEDEQLTITYYYMEV